MNANELIELLRVAQRPVENMRIHFTKELFDRSLTSQTLSQADEELLLPTAEYTLTLIGRRGAYLETLKSGGYKRYEKERDIRKTFCTIIPFVSEIKFNLFGCSDFNGRKYYIDRTFDVSEDARDGFYVLESIERDGRSTWFTVDGNKGYNVVRVQRLFDDGRVNFESIHDVKKYPDGKWFTSGYDMIRYADPQTGREARFHRCVRVTDVEFDIEFDEKTFKLPEGVDAITRPS